MKNKRKVEGITLIALIITIVVLLILAGITIGTLTGENGLIGNSQEAKEQTEIANEKEVLEQATLQAMGVGKYGEISKEMLEQKLDTIAGKEKTEVEKVGDFFEICFVESKRYYQVDSDGNVGDYQIAVQDEFPGDITKGNSLDGSKEKPYEINCIEDLVAFSNMTNGNGIRLENGQAIGINSITDFKGKYVILKRSLNFQSKYSYIDSKRTDFGDINENTLDGNALITEMTTGTGFRAIGLTNSFLGNFDGKNYKIQNIYIDYSKEERKSGLFAQIGENSSIQNLEISGEIKSIWITGGITGSISGQSRITNCINYVNAEGKNMVGGIVGNGNGGKISYCKNYGQIDILGSSYQYGGGGGIIGENGNIENCENYGMIEGNFNVGGIIGSNAVMVTNCKNDGKIIVSSSGYAHGGAAGICGYTAKKNTAIVNCFNRGEIIAQNGFSGGIIGWINGEGYTLERSINIYNCYNLANLTSEKYSSGGIVGKIGGYAYKTITVNIENSYNVGTIEAPVGGAIVGGIYTIVPRGEEYLNFKNVYYLEGSATQAISKGNITSGEATLKSEVEMKNIDFVNLLNNNKGENSSWNSWVTGENDYPKFE